MTAAASLYEGFLDYKGPKDKHLTNDLRNQFTSILNCLIYNEQVKKHNKHTSKQEVPKSCLAAILYASDAMTLLREFKTYYAQLLPKQLLLKDEIASTSVQPKSVYIQSGKYGEGKSHDKKKIYEFYMDGMTGRHHFKVNVMSQRKAWLEYFKIADEQVDIGVYDQVTVHSQVKQAPASYGNIETGYSTHAPIPATYNTLPATSMTSPQHYATSNVVPQQYASSHHTPAQQYASHASPYHSKKVVKAAVQTMPSNRFRENTPSQGDDNPPPLPPGRDEIPPPLPPGREEYPPSLPPGREDVPPPLPPGREDVAPPLPPGREDVPPPLPPGREDYSPSGRDDDVAPPLPPGRPIESPPHSAPVSGRTKQQGFGFAISPGDLQKAHDNISDSAGKLKGHRLDKRDSGNVSGDGTIFHTKPHHVIKVTSKSAPSSCEGQFGARSNQDEGYPSSSESTPCHSGGATFSIAKDHLHYKWCVEGVGRDQAEEMVKPEQDGTMLYRINGEKHAITIKRKDKIYHHLVTRQGGKFIFRGLDNVTGTSVYNIVYNYLEHCKGRVIPFGGSIDAKKEGHEDYDKPWNPPDVKILVSQVAKELEKKTKKKNAPHDSPSRRLSESHKAKPTTRAGSVPIVKCSSSGQPSAPIVEDEQTDYVNEGEDAEEDEIYENTEPEEVYLNTASRDDIYQNTPDISRTNVDSHEAYMNLSPRQPPAIKAKLPKATPRITGGQQYINAAAERVQDYAYSDSDHYLKLQPDEPEEVYEPMDH